VRHAVPLQGPQVGHLACQGLAALVALRQQSQGDVVRPRVAGSARGLRREQAGTPHKTAVQENRQVHLRASPAGSRQSHVLLRKRLLPGHPAELEGDDFPDAGTGHLRDG